MRNMHALELVFKGHSLRKFGILGGDVIQRVFIEVTL